MNRLFATCPKDHTQMIASREWFELPKDLCIQATCVECKTVFDATHNNSYLMIPATTGQISTHGLG